MIANTANTFLWISPEATGSTEVVKAAALDFRLEARFCTYPELLDELRYGPPRMAGVEFGQNIEASVALLKQLHARAPRTLTFVASADSSVQVIRTALKAGASDFLSLPLDRRELDKVLIKLTQPGVERLASSIMGEVITVCGVRGGLGVTTLAVNLAVRLAGMSESRVALMDLDLQRGDVAAFLNLTPTQSLEALASARGEIDELFLQDVMARHSSGLFVLAAPSLIEEADAVGHVEIEAALRVLRAHFGYTVIDTARTITPATLAALENSDRIFVLMDLSVPGVRAARRFVDLLGRLNIANDRFEVMVNTVVPGVVSPEDALRAIGKPPLLTIPNDPMLANRLMNAGTPLNGATDAGLAACITALAAKIAGVAPEAPGHRSLFQRLLSRRGKAES